MFSGTAQVSIRFAVFFVSSVRLLVRVTTVDKRVSAGELRKLCDSLSKLRSSLCDSPETCAIACLNCAVYSVFPSYMTSHSKIFQFN
jgi:hypothetical protein